ncbi:MAG: hypothetical protein RIR40_940 [Actinomycetota bacterium]|jgi:hypothetical protein
MSKGENLSELTELLLAHHENTEPVHTLQDLRAVVKKLPISEKLEDLSRQSGETQIFALLVDARSGISKAMISAWQYFQERQFPRVMIVQGIEFSESDFDDIVLIGNRVLEQFATPYLVLHDDLGVPTALISLEDNLVHDYSGKELNKFSADMDLVDLVSDFQDEYLQIYKEMGDDGFFQGIFAIAIPIGSTKPFGIAELNSIIESLAKR